MPTITGTLLSPTGSPIANAEIRITAETTASVVYGLTGSVITSDTGLYNFTLNTGTYLIEVLFDGVYIRSAVVLIDGTVPSTLTLETLIKDHATFIPSTIDS